MNEKIVLKKSVYVFMIGCVIAIILGIIFHEISYLLGFILGYVINYLIFSINIKMTDAILKLSVSTPIIVIMFILKLFLYALGFMIAIKISLFHLFGVFAGYLVMKLTIYGLYLKGGE